MDYLFVGYDPGLTTALALVGLDGNLVAVKSGRELKEREVIEFIRTFGKPLFVCADKTPVPAAVEKLAAIFETAVFAPKQQLSVEAKKELCGELALDNAHERDAAAAALNAHNFYANKIRNLRKKFSGEQIANILRGKAQETQKEAEEEPEKPVKQTDVPALLRQVKIIEEDRKRLKERLAALESELVECKKRMLAQVREAPKEKAADKTVAERDLWIQELKRSISKAEATIAEERKNKRTAAGYYELALEGKTPVKVIEELSERAILGLERSLGIAKGDVVLCKRPGGKKPAEMLAQRGISALIVKGLPAGVAALLEEKKIRIWAPEQAKIAFENGVAFVEKYEKTEEVGIEGIIRSYKESRGSAKTD